MLITTLPHWVPWTMLFWLAAVLMYVGQFASESEEALREVLAEVDGMTVEQA